MTCSCKDNTSVRSDADLNPAQEQYLIDLLNRDYSEAGERTDAGQMKCKVGKPCNGRCIPQNHKCGAPGGLRPPAGGAGEHPEYNPNHDPANAGAGYYNRTKKAIKIRNGIGAGLAAAAVAGGAALAHGQVQKAGGYGAVGKNVANKGLNAAEGTIKGADRAVQGGLRSAVRGIKKTSEAAKKVGGALRDPMGVAKQIQKNSNDPQTSPEMKKMSENFTAKFKEKAESENGAVDRVAGGAVKAVRGAGKASRNASGKSRAYVQALRNKINK